MFMSVVRVEFGPTLRTEVRAWMYERCPIALIEFFPAAGAVPIPPVWDYQALPAACGIADGLFRKGYGLCSHLCEPEN
jgi:hypothetical protein